MGATTGPATGRCLCGKVRFTAPKAETEVHVCHCAMCRRWTGGPEFAVSCGSRVTFDGAEHIRAYRSSDWAERAFCVECGSGLYYRLIENDEIIMNAGLFDDQDRFTLAGQIFVDEKPGWYDLANETPMKTGAEVVAEFLAGERKSP